MATRKPAANGNGANGNGVSPERLTFNIHWTLKLIVGAFAASALFYGTTSGLRNDISSIRNQQDISAAESAAEEAINAERQLRLKAEESLAKVIAERDALKAKLEDERQRAITEAVSAMTRRLELQSFEQAKLKEALTQAGIKVKED